MPLNILQAAAGQVYRGDFDASLDEVSRVCSVLRGLALERGGTDWATQLDLGLAEAMTNVVRHGYAGRGGRIALACWEEEAQWCLDLVDHGRPIPPERLAAIDGSVFDFDPLDTASIPEGGMGLALICLCFDQVDYRAGGDVNRLRLVKRLPESAT